MPYTTIVSELAKPVWIGMRSPQNPMKKTRTGMKMMMTIPQHGLKMKRMMVGRDNRYGNPMKCASSSRGMIVVGAIKINMIIRNDDCVNSRTSECEETQNTPHV